MRSFAPKTLAGRLALGGIAWIGVWAVALLLAFNVLLSHVLAGQVDVALRARAEAVAATIQVKGATLAIAEGDDEALDTGTTIYLGNDVFEGNNLSSELQHQLVQRGERTADSEKLGPVRYLAEPIHSHGRQVATIVVSSDVGQLTGEELVIGVASIGFITLLLIFTFFALRATVGRAMRPVGAMGDQASAWSDRDIDRRFDPGAGPQELRQLAITLNALLERIAATVRHERSFTTELAHELRTPLAHLHAELDLMAAGAADPVRPEPVGEDDLGRLLISVRRLEDLVESALAPAIMDTQGALGLGLVSDVVADLPRPPATTATLTVTGDTTLLLAVEADIARRALLPVLENAWRYAVHEVGIEITAADGVAFLKVIDDGGELEPAQAENIFTPGFRGTVTDGHPGAGLGLALTRRICRSASGDATASVVSGRTVITLTFPCIQS
jgi:two-component system heavy metal sensor histidine kinase CusS